MQVDFAPPVGYQEPERIPKPMEDDEVKKILLCSNDKYLHNIFSYYIVHYA